MGVISKPTPSNSPERLYPTAPTDDITSSDGSTASAHSTEVWQKIISNNWTKLMKPSFSIVGKQPSNCYCVFRPLKSVTYNEEAIA